MIFLTTGTYPLPFDRIIRMTEKALERNLITDTIIAQTGHCKYIPRKMNHFATIDKIDFDKYMRQADFIISHAGVGSIVGALELKKPILVVPRLKVFNEHVNDHQLFTAKKFEELGHVLAAYSEDDFFKMLCKVRQFKPNARKSKVDLVSKCIGQFIEKLLP